MVQDEKGIFSRCICPNCFHTCNACMGTEQKPLSQDAFREFLLDRERYDNEHEYED